MGYGIVESDDSSLAVVAYGAIKCRERQPLTDRLRQIYEKLDKIITQFEPDAAAIETPFVGDNVRSALAIGKAQGVAMLAAAMHGIPIFEYSPAAVKHHVADYGASTKEQMQEMVKLLLDLVEIPQPHDAADALAIAICHSREMTLNEMRMRE